MNKALKLLVPLCVFAVASCTDTAELEDRLDDVESRIAALESSVSSLNETTIALQKVLQGTMILSMKESETGYVLEFTDGTSLTVTYGDKVKIEAPVIGVDKDGNWIISTDGGSTFSKIDGAANALDNEGATPQVKVDENGYWAVSTDGGSTWTTIKDKDGKPIEAGNGSSLGSQGSSAFISNITVNSEGTEATFSLATGEVVTAKIYNEFRMDISGYTEGMNICLGEILAFPVELSEVAKAAVSVPDGWNAVLSDNQLDITGPSTGVDGECTVSVFLISNEGFLRTYNLKFTLKAVTVDANACDEWKNFVAGNDANLLLDYSYAGYDHGESAPLEYEALGWKVYDVTDYGAIPNDGKSDRDAFIKAATAALGAFTETSDKSALRSPSVNKANAVIYFPAGEYILHTEDDNVTNSNGKLVSQTIRLRAGNLLIKGAGKGLTTIVMQDPNLPTNESTLYSSPQMLEIKHDSGLSDLTSVTGNSAKGSFSVEVGSTAGISAGDWVCLYLKNNDSDLIAEELSPRTVQSTMTDLINNGVQVMDYHQVKSVSGNTVTFYEPIMHKVESKWDWKLCNYPHYENVGVEDLTFKGNAKAKFVHHGSWQDDGAYKPINLVRLTNAWMRRVGFVSVSEACSIVSCANVSAYSIDFSGNRGHAAVRAQASSRVFIGATTDKSSGYLVDNSSTFKEGAGQYHAVGVSKQSMGTVLWRNLWGNDSCFESHATQPRATLIDCCEGGWMRWRQGGDASQVPNHLADLTVWNFNSITPSTGEFIWWDSSSTWWKFIQPIIIGFHGEKTTFKAADVTTDSHNGEIVAPESLYEAQLRIRLGSVPAWLQALK